jgi:hypothetical protein
MISALVAAMKLTVFSLFLSISVYVPSVSNAASAGRQPAAATQAPFSVDDFDWREMVPSLFAASALPGEEGIKALLENSKILRSYVTKEVQTECKPGGPRCDSSRNSFTVKGEVTKRIDGIVQEGMLHRNKTSYVDYTMGKSFSFSEIVAIRSDKREDAYLLLQPPITLTPPRRWRPNTARLTIPTLCSGTAFTNTG